MISEGVGGAWYLIDSICCLWRSSSLVYAALGVMFLGVEGFIGLLGVEGAEAFFFCKACKSSTFWRTPFNGGAAVSPSLQTSRDTVFFVLILDRPFGTRTGGVENAKSPFAIPLEAMYCCWRKAILHLCNNHFGQLNLRSLTYYCHVIHREGRSCPWHRPWRDEAERNTQKNTISVVQRRARRTEEEIWIDGTRSEAGKWGENLNKRVLTRRCGKMRRNAHSQKARECK